MLSRGDEKSDQVRQNVERAITELGANVTVSVLTDEDEIRSFGVHPSQTPAVVTARYQLHCTQRVPDAQIVKEWIKALQ